MPKNTTDYTTKESLWKERYALAQGNQQKMFRRFANWYDALYAQVNTQASPWRSKVYVPILARQTWALVSKFLALKPGFEVRVRDASFDDEDIREKAEKAQKLLEYNYDNPDLDETVRDKLFAVLLDACVTGTGLAKVPWTVKTKKRYERIVDDFGNVDMTQEKVTTKTTGFNDVIPVNIFNVYVSPAATDLYTAPWIIIREQKTLKELKDAGIYKNLDGLNNYAAPPDSASYNPSRNRLLSQQDQTDPTTKMVGIYECYDQEGNILTFAEDGTKWTLLNERKNIYWHGKYPLVKFHVKKKPFSFWGEGLFETTYRLQAVYNDAVNNFMDSWNVSNAPMLMVPERANINDYVIEPAGTITYRGDQAPQPFKHMAPDPNQLSTILGLMDSAIEGVTVSQYASGNPNSATDKTKGTATGIVKLQEAAGDVVSFMRSNFSQSILQVGKFWLSNNQQFMQDTQTIMANNGAKIEPVEVGPADIQGDLDLTIDDASMKPETDEERRDNYNSWLQGQMMIKQAADTQAQQLGTPPMGLNYTEMSESHAENYGLKNFDKILMSEDELNQVQQEGMAQAMAQMGQDPNMPMQEDPNDPDAQTAQMAQELMQQGHLDPAQLQASFQGGE